MLNVSQSITDNDTPSFNVRSNAEIIVVNFSILSLDNHKCNVHYPWITSFIVYGKSVFQAECVFMKIKFCVNKHLKFMP